jgi:hypothetical protein
MYSRELPVVVARDPDTPCSPFKIKPTEREIAVAEQLYAARQYKGISPYTFDVSGVHPFSARQVEVTIEDAGKLIEAGKLIKATESASTVECERQVC